jgi:short-subunit dehydrogenase
MPNAIITGATKGIGKAIADKLIANGFDIAICARTIEDLQLIKEAYQQRYPERKVYIQAVDVANKDDVKNFGENALSFFNNELQILVNNAGIYMPGNCLDEEDGQLEATIQVNLYSAYYLTRIVVEAMKASAPSHIFNINSIAGLQAYPGGGSYSISKYALLGFSDNIRLELRDSGVKVTAICPGAVWSNSWEGSGVSPERIMEATDIAETLWSAYQLSDRAVVERIVLRPQLGDL